MSLGRKESPYLVIRRCLALAISLQRGPTGKDRLIAAVLDAVGRDAYGGVSGRRLDKRFDGDKRKLRDLFGVTLRYSRSTESYQMAGMEQPWLDLPDDSLQAMAFLQEAFGPGAPQHQQVQRLLALLQSYLPAGRRRELEGQRAGLQVTWGRRDRDLIPALVEDGLGRALSERRMVEFDYHSPAQEDSLPRRHVVEPWERYFDSVRGHYYLRGFCRYTVGPPGRRRQNRYFRYRLGRIRNLQILPSRLPPYPPKVPKVEISYRLAPEIARRGEVTRHPGIEIAATEPQGDGGVVVRAETAEVWWAVRTLLHYGPNCQVLGGREALDEMRRTVAEMARVYQSGQDTG